jgi:mannose-6-phosphate isomerase-like protein (cupin superfamily)
VSEFKVMRAADAPDYTGGDPSPFLGYGRPLGSEQIAFNVRVLAPGATHVPPGEDPSGGHHHRTIEEIYFVIDGEVKVKAGDEVVTLGKRDAILFPADMPRGARNETDSEAALAMISVRVEDQRAESVMVEGHWPTG